MYNRILVPTDGSPRSLKAVRAGADLAKKLNASLDGVYVIPTFVAGYAGEGIYINSEKDYMLAMKDAAQHALRKIEAIARKAGIDVDVSSVESMSPWEGILKAAAKRKCDMIVMASHGRGSLASAILGSQTNKVLAHSKIPVLVVR